MLTVGMIRALMRSWADEREEDVSFAEDVVRRAIEEASNLLPVFGPAIIQPLIRYSQGRGMFSFSENFLGSAIDDLLRFSTDAAKLFEGELYKEYNRGQLVERWTRALKSAAEVAQYGGLPGGGISDLLDMAGTAVKRRVHPDLRAAFEEKDRPTSEERKERANAGKMVWHGIESRDPDSFRRGLARMKTQGMEVTRGRLRARVRDHYDAFTKYDPESTAYDDVAWNELSPIDREVAIEALEERDERLDLLDEYIAENPDLVEATGDLGLTFEGL